MDLELSRHISRIALRVTKRDVASAFRVLKLHPAMALVMVTEFPASHVHLENDVVCFYLAMPFGWNGAPAHFARFGGAITRAHSRCGLSRKCNTLMKHAYRSVLYVGDGIFVELDIAERMAGTNTCWEFLTRGVLGNSAINLEKLDEEGTWESKQILLGFTYHYEN